MVDLLNHIARVEPNPRLQSMFDFTNDVDVLAMTLDGEGRSQSIYGRTAIAWTVKNRQLGLGPAADKGKRINEVCLRKAQYSTWFPYGGAVNYARQMQLAEAVVRRMPNRNELTVSQWAKFSESRYLAIGVLHGNLIDPTRGATHYLTRHLYETNPPAWAATATGVRQIEDHMFLTGVK
jgi:N-acetylmuramoyl-L-alanine amidase